MTFSLFASYTWKHWQCYTIVNKTNYMECTSCQNHQYGVCQSAYSSPFLYSFLIARDINIVAIVPISQFNMDDASWCQHLLNCFSWLRQKLALVSITAHGCHCMSATRVYGQVWHSCSLSCLVDMLLFFVLLPVEVFTFWWQNMETSCPYLQVCTS